MEIKIKENEFRALLDRDGVISDVKRAFPEQLELLRDLTNYGSNLIPRCFGTCGKELKDLVVIGILLRQVVAMLDGVEILVSNGAVHAAGLQARALFEASVYIDWILKADADSKATFYYVHNLRTQRRWARRAQAGSAEAAEFAASMPDLASFQTPKMVEEAKKMLQEIDRVLSQPSFQPVSRAFDKCARKNGSDRAWYCPLGVKSVSDIMKAVGRTSHYALFYGTWSETMHSSNYRQHIHVGAEKVTFDALRYLLGFEPLFRFSVATVIDTYRKILQSYRPGEIAAFNRKYMGNWRKALMEIPKIKYEVNSASVG